jgi:hypothetical protein
MKKAIVKKIIVFGLLILLLSLPYSLVYASPSVIISQSNNKTRDQYDFVIIAYPTWYDYEGDWDLQTLVDWHNNNDTLLTYKVNLLDILDDVSFWVKGKWGDGNANNPYRRTDEDSITNYEMFNDTQAKVRNYIRYAHHELGVKYALLIGDHEHIPCRQMYVHGEGAPAPKQEYNDNVPADMYFGCLNGTWNDDEDTYSPSGAGWGENATLNSDNNIDEADWSWEVAIGRLCPDTPIELKNAIRKTISYMDLTGDELYLSNISLAGHHAGWGGKAEWGAEYSKQLNGTTCDDWDHETYGFNPEIFNIFVVDANPQREEGIDFTDENAREIFNNGVHVWYQCGHGSQTTWWNSGGYGDAFDPTDVYSLTNTFYGLVFSAIPCRSGQFDTTDCLSEIFVNDEHGAFASVMNSRYGWGSYINLHSTNHFHGREFFDACFNENIYRVGDMLADAGHDCDWLLIEDDPGTIRWALYEKNLIGSPAVKMKFKAPEPSDLKCDGNLIWYNVEPGESVAGNFNISNLGELGLNWEIAVWPDWGEWTFYPDSGNDLPGGESFIVNLMVVAPEEPKKEFKGVIIIENTDNPDDYDIIAVYLRTPRSRNYFNSIYTTITNRFPFLFKFIEILFT